MLPALKGRVLTQDKLKDSLKQLQKDGPTDSNLTAVHNHNDRLDKLANRYGLVKTLGCTGIMPAAMWAFSLLPSAGVLVSGTLIGAAAAFALGRTLRDILSHKDAEEVIKTLRMGLHHYECYYRNLKGYAEQQEDGLLTLRRNQGTPPILITLTDKQIAGLPNHEQKRILGLQIEVLLSDRMPYNDAQQNYKISDDFLDMSNPDRPVLKPFDQLSVTQLKQLRSELCLRAPYNGANDFIPAYQDFLISTFSVAKVQKLGWLGTSQNKSKSWDLSMQINRLACAERVTSDPDRFPIEHITDRLSNLADLMRDQANLDLPSQRPGQSAWKQLLERSGKKQTPSL